MKDNDQPLLTPYDKAKRCKYFDQGTIIYCDHGTGPNHGVIRLLQKGRELLVFTRDRSEKCNSGRRRGTLVFYMLRETSDVWPIRLAFAYHLLAGY